jgi:hypothetical protein
VFANHDGAPIWLTQGMKTAPKHSGIAVSLFLNFSIRVRLQSISDRMRGKLRDSFGQNQALFGCWLWAIGF